VARAPFASIDVGGGEPTLVDDLRVLDWTSLSFCTRPASIGGLELKLINSTQRTRKLLALTNLDSVLEICSPHDVEWSPGGAEHAHAAEVEPNLY
jgi:hypothetical protein